MSNFGGGLLQAAKAGQIFSDALSGGPKLRRQQAEKTLSIQEGNLAARERELAESERVGKLQYSEEGTGTEQRKVDVMERQVAAAESDPDIAWNIGMKDPVKITTRATMKKLSKDIPSMGPLLGSVEEMLDGKQINTRQELYDHLKQTKATGGFTSIVNGIAEQISKLQEKGDSKSRQKIQQLQQIGDAIQQDGFIDGLFNKPEEEAESAGAMGSMVEYQDKNGRVHILPSKVQPPEGWRKVRMGFRMTTTPEGGTTVEQGVLPYAGMKQTPSGQAEKLGAMKGYQELMTQMDDIMITSTGDLTGPLEFLKKTVDDWDWKAFSSMDRVRLRGLVANLKDYFYSAFGKQISDRELSELSAMMPRMNQNERPFKESMHTFWGAIMAMTKAKAEGLRASGYDVPESIELDPNNEGVRRAINIRGNAIMQRFLNEGMSEADAAAAAKAQVKSEFSLE